MKYLILLTFLFSFSSFGQDNAVKKTTEALLKHEKIKLYLKNTKKNLGIKKHHVRYAMAAKMLAERKLSSRMFRNFEFKHKNFSVNLEANYDFNEDEMYGLVKFNWEF